MANTDSGIKRPLVEIDYMASFGLTCSEIGLLQGLFSCPRCWVLQIQNAGNDLNLLQVASLEGLQAVRCLLQ